MTSAANRDGGKGRDGGEKTTLAAAATRALAQGLGLYLDLKSRPRPLRRYLAGRPATAADWRVVDPRAVRVAAVQMRLTLVKSAREYAALCHEACRQAAATGALLIAFPEDAATHLLGLMPAIDRLAAAGSVDGALAGMGGDALEVADIFRLMGRAMRRIYLTTFSHLARAFNVYIVAGSAVLPEEARRDRGRHVLAGRDARQGERAAAAPKTPVYNEAYLFDRWGQVAGRQRKLHLLPMEEGWGLSPGLELSVFGSPLGRVAMPVCMDSTYFETFRIAEALDADICVVPSANPEQYNFWKALRGVWPRVQEGALYGVHSCMVGDLFGLKLTGRSGIFGPLELTPRRDGVLAQLDDPLRPGVVSADLDLLALRELREQRRPSRPSRGMWRELSAAYAEYRARCGPERSRP